MNKFLVRKLIACGAIRQDTVVEIEYGAPNLSCSERARVTGEFKIQRGINDAINDRVIFDVVKEGAYRRIDCASIIQIDGMDPDRFARNYNLDVDGNDLPIAKKRGRVPRAKVAQVSNAA